MAKGEYGCQDDVLRVLPPTLAAKHPDLNDDADNDSHEEKRSVFELELEETEAKHAIFEIGEMVNVTEGPFESFNGAVEDFDQEKQKVKISISIFGRATSVELDVTQVEKVS